MQLYCLLQSNLVPFTSKYPIICTHSTPSLLLPDTTLLIYNATAKSPASAAAMPISSFPAAPVDSATPPDFVALPAVAPELGDPVIDGEVELPEGMTIMLPEAVADALLPDAVADAEVGMLVAVEE
jgi:hypothetical protein